MICPKCKSSNIGVTDTMPLGDAEIFRRRKCRDCGYGFRTMEMLDDGSVDFKRKYNEAVLTKSDLFRSVKMAKMARKEEHNDQN